jgi:O-antigen/teichoic acid export membrane protein
MRIKNISDFAKNTFSDTLKLLTSKSALKDLYDVSLYRNAFYLMVNSAAGALTGFFFWIAAARLYPVDTVGLTSAAIGAAGFLTLFSTLGLDQGIIRFLPGAGDKARDLINSIFSVVGVISLVLAVIFLDGLNIWSPAQQPIRENPVFFAVFVLFTVASLIQNFTNQVFIAKRRAGFALTQGLLFSLLRFVPLFILAAYFKTFGIFASLAIAILITVTLSTLIFLPRVEKGYLPRPVIKKEIIKEMVGYSAANYAAGILWQLPQAVLPLIVVNLLGTEQNAYYYIGWSVSAIVFAIPAAVSFSLFAEGSHHQDKLGIEIMRALKLLSVILIPAIVILAIFNSKILALFGAAYSENGTKLFWFLIFSVIPLSINYIYYGIKRVEKKIKPVIILAACAAGIIVGLSYMLLPRMGIMGAGVAWLSGQGAASVFVVYSLLKRH